MANYKTSKKNKKKQGPLAVAADASPWQLYGRSTDCDKKRYYNISNKVDKYPKKTTFYM